MQRVTERVRLTENGCLNIPSIRSPSVYSIIPDDKTGKLIRMASNRHPYSHGYPRPSVLKQIVEAHRRFRLGRYKPDNISEDELRSVMSSNRVLPKYAFLYTAEELKYN